MRYFFTIFCFVLCQMMAFSGVAKLTWSDIQSDFQESLKHANDGVVDGRIMPFGNSRLISESSGVKGKRFVMAGVEIIIDQGWVLNTPVIKAEATGGYQTTVLPQFRTNADEDENWTDHYTKHVIFPILLEGEPTTDVVLNVRADWSACSEVEKRCLDAHEKYQLTLPIEHGYHTSVAAPINRAIISAALDIGRSRVKMENTIGEDHQIKVRLVFPEKVKFVSLQSVEKPFQIIHKSLTDRVFDATLNFEDDIHVGDIIPLYIKSSGGNYTAKMIVGDAPLTPIPDDVSVWIAFWTGVFFLITCSAWPLLMSPQTMTNGDFRKEVRRLQLGIIAGMLGLLALWLAGMAPSLWIQNEVFLIAVLVAVAYLCVRPVQKVWVIALGILLLPKPFWYLIDGVSAQAKIGLIVWWGICVLIPFNVWILCARPVVAFFRQVVRQPHGAYNIFVRMPYFVLLGWLGIGALYPIMTNEKITDMAEIKTPAVVQIAPSVCFTCALNQWRILPFLPVSVYRVDAGSDIVKKLPVKKNESALVYMTANNRIVILPDHLTLYQARQALRRE